MTPLQIAIEALEEIAEQEQSEDEEFCNPKWIARDALEAIKREQLLNAEKTTA